MKKGFFIKRAIDNNANIFTIIRADSDTIYCKDKYGNKKEFDKKDILVIDIELTNDELSDAHELFVTNWMESILIDDFCFIPEVAEDLAPEAYAEYCKGNGLTEYECIEKIADQYNEEMEK